MKTLTSLFLSTGILFSGGSLQGNSPQGGIIAVYGIHYQGVATASGEPYRMDQMTAAHDSLTFGSIVRVAHFETGKMVDVRVNDRKPRDSRLLNLSHAAGQALGIAPNRTVQGSMYLVRKAAPRTAVSTPAVTTQARTVAPIAPLDNQVQKPFWPFAGMKQQKAMRKAVKNPRADRGSEIVAGKTGLFGRSKPAQYGIPAEQYSPPVSADTPQQKQGIFSGLFAYRNQQQLAAPAAGKPVNAGPPSRKLSL